LDYEFPEWKPGKHWAINVLLSIKKLLHLEEYYSLPRDSGEKAVLNKPAQTQYT
jgi:hypothetical protein